MLVLLDRTWTQFPAPTAGSSAHNHLYFQLQRLVASGLHRHPHICAQIPHRHMHVIIVISYTWTYIFMYIHTHIYIHLFYYLHSISHPELWTVCWQWQQQYLVFDEHAEAQARLPDLFNKNCLLFSTILGWFLCIYMFKKPKPIFIILWVGSQVFESFPVWKEITTIKNTPLEDRHGGIQK